MAVSFGTALDHFQSKNHFSQTQHHSRSKLISRWDSVTWLYSQCPSTRTQIRSVHKDAEVDENSCAINSPFTLMSGTNCSCHPCRYFSSILAERAVQRK